MWLHAELLGALIDAVAGACGAVFRTVRVVARGYRLAVLPMLLDTPFNGEVLDAVVAQVGEVEMLFVVPQADWWCNRRAAPREEDICIQNWECMNWFDW